MSHPQQQEAFLRIGSLPLGDFLAVALVQEMAMEIPRPSWMPRKEVTRKVVNHVTASSGYCMDGRQLGRYVRNVTLTSIRNNNTCA